MRHRRATAAIIAALSVTAITQTSVSGSQPDPGGPSIDVSPDGAAAGATVTVTGSGFVGDCDVVLYWRFRRAGWL